MINHKSLLLGTAQWGWTVSREEAFRLMDAWRAAGHRKIDAATNYPINRSPADFRASERILLEYIQAQGQYDLDLTMKIGSLDNMRTPEINLAPSFILMMTEEYRRIFGDNLRCVMLHWDNRADASAIRASLEALAVVQQTHEVRVGLSGILHPDIYASVNRDTGLTFDIQLKHNVLHSDISRYVPFYQPLSGTSTAQASPPAHRFFAYGINAGGVKLEGPYPAGSTFVARGGDPDKTAATLESIRQRLPHWNLAQVRPPVRTMNQLGLIFAGLHPQLNGIVLGLRSVAQLQESLDFWRNLDTFDYSDVFAALGRL